MPSPSGSAHKTIPSSPSYSIGTMIPHLFHYSRKGSGLRDTHVHTVYVCNMHMCMYIVQVQRNLDSRCVLLLVWVPDIKLAMKPQLLTHDCNTWAALTCPVALLAIPHTGRWVGHFPRKAGQGAAERHPEGVCGWLQACRRYCTRPSNPKLRG